MDRRIWWAAVGVAKSRTRESDFHFAGARVCAKRISCTVSFRCHAVRWLPAPPFYRTRPEAQGGHGICLGHTVPKELGCSLPGDMVTAALFSEPPQADAPDLSRGSLRAIKEVVPVPGHVADGIECGIFRSYLQCFSDPLVTSGPSPFLTSGRVGRGREEGLTSVEGARPLPSQLVLPRRFRGPNTSLVAVHRVL